MGISDAAIWEREYLRQLHSVKGALHSLKLQAVERQKLPNSHAVRRLGHNFDCVIRAFDELNRPKPEPENHNGDFIPTGRVGGRRPTGRREFLADLKHRPPSPDG